MSRVDADNFYTAGSAATGAIGLPGGTTASRPSSNLPNGGLRYNSEENSPEIYDGAWGFLTNPKNGASAATAIDYPSDAAGLYTGQTSLWTTAGGNTSPFLIRMDFDRPGGPWYMASFNFASGITSGGMNNDMCMGTNSATNDGFKGAYNESVDIGFGLQNIPSLYGHSITAVQGEGITVTGEVTTGGSGGTTALQNINYYNHATQSNFTTAQMSALRASASQLSIETPFVAGDYDSDGNQQTQLTDGAWYVGTPQTSGYVHVMYIEDEDGNQQKLVIGASDPSNNGQVYVWTHNQCNHFREYQDGGIQGEGNKPHGLLNSKMILPTRWKVYTGSGGGASFGAYFNPAIGRLNSRVVFLFK
jgi:hypothetical protein